MPTLLNERGFKFFFYANEHEPKHIHILKGDDFAKVNLEDLTVVLNTLKPKELKVALEIVKANQDNFTKAWYEWFNKS